MTRRRPWHHAARRLAGRAVTHQLLRLFNFLPAWEYGLTRPQLTHLPIHHPPLRGRRAVQLSDLHLDRYLYRHDHVLRMVRDLRPDWIFVTGDLIDLASGLPHCFRFLSGLRWIAPVFVTLGNHDHYSGVPIERFADLAERHKITLLINDFSIVSAGQTELAIVGVDDPSLHRARLHCIPPASDDRFTLLLAHAPNILDQLEEQHEVDLILCGHSHGGQWRPPLLEPFWLPPGCKGRAHGLYEAGRHRLYVNRGLGWSLLPLRWNCAPEILLIEWMDVPECRAAAS
ncbi:metallophosphoesterase [Nitrospira sp.]|nr:metallophosphoesterase [Nitrospira sp.]